ncbi:hypothetical protein [Streptomyces sp. NPDC002825]|uniref:ATP-grasp domain-containing protein n=1 Tax=Streptomyces sp. NPDC002825 TaxID=3154666 RepID=UPI0033301019
MSLIAVINLGGSADLGDLLDSADGLCDLVLVNVADTPWSAHDRAALEGIVDFVEGTGRPVGDLCEDLAARGVTGVVTFSDEMIPTAAEVARRLGLPYHDPDTALAVTHKDEQRRRLTEAGLRQPRHASFTDEAGMARAVAHVGFPAVLKPVCGNGSTNVFPVEDEDGLRAALAQAAEGTPERATVYEGRHGFASADPWQLEERIVGVPHPAGDSLADYVSVETLTLGPGDHWHFWVTDRLPMHPPLREGGATGPSQLPDALRDEVCATVAAGLDAVGVTTGISHTEVKLTADGPCIIEINGRIGGMISQLVRAAGGQDAMRAALQAAMGRPERGEDTSDRYSCAMFVQAPTDAVRVRRLVDPARLHEVPGVWRVDSHVSPGTEIDLRTGVLGRLQTVWLGAATPEELRGACDRVREVLKDGNEYDTRTDVAAGAGTPAEARA